MDLDADGWRQTLGELRVDKVRLARTVHWSVPRDTPPAVSYTPRFVYLPRPKHACNEPSRKWTVDQTFSVQPGSDDATDANVETVWCVKNSSAGTNGPRLLTSAA